MAAATAAEVSVVTAVLAVTAFGGHAFFGARFGHFDHGRFARFDHDRFHHFRFRRHFFFAGIGPGFYDWPYDDYSYSSCRVLTPRGWVWVCQ